MVKFLSKAGQVNPAWFLFAVNADMQNPLDYSPIPL